MLFNQDRMQLRQFFFSSWRKYLDHQPLEPLEQQLVNVILLHPEYHAILNHPERYQDKDYLPELGETNPFLHMALHLSLLEQINTNRPFGIRDIYQKLTRQSGDSHEAEHLMLNCLAETIWQAQRSGKMPDENFYLSQLKHLLKS